MAAMKSARLQERFAELTDPRRREVLYPLTNIVVIAICAVICGADDFVAIAAQRGFNLGVGGSRGLDQHLPRQSQPANYREGNSRRLQRRSRLGGRIGLR
jgi:hypothetical protein